MSEGIPSVGKKPHEIWMLKTCPIQKWHAIFWIPEVFSVKAHLICKYKWGPAKMTIFWIWPFATSTQMKFPPFQSAKKQKTFSMYNKLIFIVSCFSQCVNRQSKNKKLTYVYSRVHYSWDHGHTMTKFLILCVPNSIPNPKWKIWTRDSQYQIGCWIGRK